MEIKFRAWDKRENRMSEPSAIWFSYAQGPHIIELCGENRKPEEVELMQFTGDEDVIGQEVFNGDIIIYLHDSGRGYEYNIDYIRYNGYYGYEPMCLGIGNYRVIGNIWENPDMLKNSKYTCMGNTYAVCYDCLGIFDKEKELIAYGDKYSGVYKCAKCAEINSL